MRKIEKIHPNPPLKKEGIAKNSPCFFKKKRLGDGLLKTTHGPLDTRYGKLAFTLVELVVVMVILAILATIAYIGLQSYPRQARDAVRITDLKNIEKAIEFFKIKDGDYPIPTNYSTGKIKGLSGTWYIGDFGEEIANKIDAVVTLPTEPISKENYKYTLSEDRQSYRIITKLEDTGKYFIVSNIKKSFIKDDGSLVYCDFSGNYNFGGCLIK